MPELLPTPDKSLKELEKEHKIIKYGYVVWPPSNIIKTNFFSKSL
jgi:hypothetical protein